MRSNWGPILILPNGHEDVSLGHSPLQGKTGNLGPIFGCVRGDVVSSREGGLVQSLDVGSKHGQDALVSAGSRSVLLGAGEKRQEGAKRKGVKGDSTGSRNLEGRNPLKKEGFIRCGRVAGSSFCQMCES
ncbi:hypothetical protein AMTR_s00006p00067550 [Amborella trichopoda]|uniref:Uncharacterized protein n=1 Tax=Amborella trichopoda TaxID=13333 RepID=W1PEX6_AMBTC|nr:hypothetical protein AMTR_s00006p00067550 [Amborella trichopoda]